MTTVDLTGIKSLTILQYEECREKALERVTKRIGAKPKRNTFKRELAPLWTILDILAVIVFIPALAVSSVHIIAHMGALAAASYTQPAADAGTVISKMDYIQIHQFGMIFLAEGSMILFMVMFGMTRAGWRRWVYLFLAAMALIFVAVANWQSGIGPLESVLAPIFTIGIGLKLEQLIIATMNRNKVVDDQYQAALAIWEASTADPTKHPDYRPILREQVWDKLVKKNPDYADAPRGVKYRAAELEMARDSWAYEAEPPPEETYETAPEVTAKPKREVKPKQVDNPFGAGGVPIVDESASMPLMLSVNGHGITEPN